MSVSIYLDVSVLLSVHLSLMLFICIMQRSGSAFSGHRRTVPDSRLYQPDAFKHLGAHFLLVSMS